MKSKTWSLMIIALVLMACSLPVDVFGTAKNMAPTGAFPSIANLPAETMPVCPTCPPPLPSTTPVVITATAEILPTGTPTLQAPSQTPTMVPTTANISYQVMPNSPFYLQNYAHPDKGCQWMGVAGQVINSLGVPQCDLVVVVEGTLNNNPVELVALTGLSDQYGLGGYEVVLSDQVIASQGSLKLTLYDLNGIVLANPVSFDTIADCQKNLILINFQQIANR